MRKEVSIIIILFSLFASVVQAANKSGVKPEVLSLPSGPSSIEGLGKSFEPQLNTGAASYSVSIQVPPGTAGHEPSLSLNYSGGRGNGHFGLGWSLNLETIHRQTDKGQPSYSNNDTFVYSNGEELVPLADGTYRAENESSFMRFRRIDDGWEVTDKLGRIYRLGQYPEVTNPVRISRIGNADTSFDQTYKWYVTSFEDTNGNRIEYFYSEFSDSPGELYLTEIRYNIFGANYNSVVFSYEARIDAYSDYRQGFEVKTGHHGSTIKVLSRGVLIREYKLDYDTQQAEVYGSFPTGVVELNTSILTKVTQFDGGGQNYLPPIRFGYTRLFTQDQDLIPTGNFPGAEDIDLNGNGALDLASPIVMQNVPASVNFQNDESDLLDVNADGLPDLFHTETTAPGNHVYHINLDGVAFANGATVANNDAFYLTDSETSLADINGDGISDLVKKPTSTTFKIYPSRGNGSWSPGTNYSNPLLSSLTDSNVRFMDVDFDKNIDIVRSISGNSWETCLHSAEADQDLEPFDNFPSPEDIDHNGNAVFDGGAWSCSSHSVPFPPQVVFSNPDVRIADFNGDRLQDVALLRLLSSSEAIVWYWLSKGNGEFATQVTMPALNPSESNKANLHFSDVNGDGLSDVIKVVPGQTTVWFNIGGTQWSAPASFNSPSYTASTTAIRFADMNSNGSNDVFWAQASGTDRFQYLDFTPLSAPNLLNLIDNGQGRQIKIQYASSTQFASDANSDGNPWSRTSPIPTSVVSRMVVSPGLELDGVAGKDQYVTDYVYRDPYYDAYEKEFRGFSFVKKIERGDFDAPTSVTRFFFHTGAPDGIDNDGDGAIDERTAIGGGEDEPLKGKILVQEMATAAGGADTLIDDGVLASDGVTYSRITNQWQLRQIYAEVDGSQPQPTLNASVVSYPFTAQTSTQILELGSGPERQLLTSFAYDDFGNQTESRNYGELNTSGDERFTFTDYINDTSQWNVGLPSEITVTDGSLNQVAITRNYYDGTAFQGLALGQVGAGNLTREEQWVQGANYLHSKRNRYDSYGNIVESYDPEGTVGENKHSSEVTFDSIFHVLPVTETLHVGDGNPALVMQAGYDLGFGTMLSSTDFNGNVTTYKYDSFGRITSLIKPGDSSGLPTTRFTYRPADPVRSLRYNYDAAGNLSLQVGVTTASAIETAQREVSGQSGTLDAVKYIDGLGRDLASVKEDSSGWVVEEFVRFNAKGTVRETYQPFNITASDYSQLNQGSDYLMTRYDATGRPVENVNPPETSGGPTTNVVSVYTPLKKTTFDELNNEMVYINDGLERLVKVEEVNQGDRYITSYAYNPKDSLERITDAQQNERLFSYDGLQRRTFMNDPNRGVMTWVYDDASNVIETIDAKGQHILHTYDGVNRLLSEDYQDEGLSISANRSPDVLYTYDVASSVEQGDGTSVTPTNTAGQLVSVVDLSGALISLPTLPAGEEYHSYDERGRTLWTVKRIPDVLSETLISYKSEMAYDSLDRITDLIYPDGDHINQTYNNRGLLGSISGSPSFIANNLQYEPSGQISHCQFGNGTTTDYEYDPRFRLTSLATTGPSSVSLIDYQYTFDGASNILRIDDQRPVSEVPADDPGRNTQLFTYDDLYRIKSVQYTFSAPGSEDGDDGTISYNYDKIGNMTEKSSAITHVENGLSVTDLGDMTYGGSIAGSNGRVGRNAGELPGPHALTNTNNGSDDRNYDYDDNGNMVNIDGLQLTWDFKDRLIAVEDSNMRAEYAYDHNDQRVMKHVVSKLGNLRERPKTTLYINESFEVREYDQPVKYIFQDGKRIARVTGNIDDSTTRTQNVRLANGWNLIAIAIDSNDTAQQLGIGSDPDIQSAYKWDPTLSTFDELNAGSALPSSSILWVESTANKIVSISGNYTSPGAATPNIGGEFVGHGNLDYALSLTTGMPSDVTHAWVYSADQQSWKALLESPLGSLSDLPEVLAPGEVVYVVSGSGENWGASVGDESIKYYHQDHIGSIDLLTNGSGLSISSNKYYPFGSVRASINDLEYPYSFSGKELDDESGLHYFEFRYLIGHIGGFVTPDPLLVTDSRYYTPQSWNPYGYARRNPIAFNDPDGREEVSLSFVDELIATAAKHVDLYEGQSLADIANGQPITETALEYSQSPGLKVGSMGIKRKAEDNASPTYSFTTPNPVGPSFSVSTGAKDITTGVSVRLGPGKVGAYVSSPKENVGVGLGISAGFGLGPTSGSYKVGVKTEIKPGGISIIKAIENAFIHSATRGTMSLP